MHPILKVKDLNVGFKAGKKVTPVLRNVNFDLNEGESLCIVGESGCGKSLTSLSIMGLLPQNAVITNGEIIFGEENLLQKSKREMSKIRGNDISMIFQEPMTSLNPVQTVGKQIAEAVRLHQQVGKVEAMKKAEEMLRLVGIPSPEKRIDDYPFEMSGGMRQRVMIAMALACNPRVLIADEPTTALDVTTQAQILALINDLKDQFNMSVIFITHDFGVVSQLADRVIVMYAGEVIESSEVRELIDNPKHPYTKGLIASIPKLDHDRKKLPTIKGTVPSPDEIPQGCVFADRCEYAKKICFDTAPNMIEHQGCHVSCWAYAEDWDEMEEVSV